jgi:uncharacterized protein YjgD (DUF1641 family)
MENNTLTQMTNEQKQHIMKIVGKYTDGIKYNMEIIYSEDTSGWLDMPIFYGVVSSLDEQEEYYYKNINTMEDYFNFVETLDAEYNLIGMKK